MGAALETLRAKLKDEGSMAQYWENTAAAALKKYSNAERERRIHLAKAEQIRSALAMLEAGNPEE